jgi:predicted permease
MGRLIGRIPRRPWLWLIRTIGMLVPKRLRADWRQEWEAELRYRESVLTDWDHLTWRTKLDLLWHSAGAFADALWLQPKRWEDEVLQDLRFGMRTLLQNPGFSAVIVLTVALGIGANAALFSVVNGVLLNPLPYPQPEQLVSLHQRRPNTSTGAISYPNFLDWENSNQTFSAMAMQRPFSASLIADGSAEQVAGRRVTANYFAVLGIEPLRGRTFSRDEDERGAAPVVMISSGLWERKFGAESHVAGKSLTLDGMNYTIAGVLPAAFGLYPGTDVYVPLGSWNNMGLQDRGAGLGFQGIGRLKPGVSLAQAQADLDRVAQNLAAAHPEVNRNIGATVMPLKDRLVGDVGPILWMLLGAVGFVLLIACVNVSNLLLARSTGRARELAVRAALGAGPWRLLRQMLTESMLLALVGGVLGLLLASWGTRAALAALPTALPRTDEVGVDVRVLLFTFAVSLLTAVLSGLTPTLKASRAHLSESLKKGGRGGSGAHHRAHGILVTVEMALALVLLIGAGLMIRSVNVLWNVDLGFRPDNVVAFEVSFPPSMRKDSDATRTAKLRELSEMLGSMPGVQAASFLLGSEPLQAIESVSFWLEGEPRPASTSEMPMALMYRVEPGYLGAMGIPLQRGRFFTAQDEIGTPLVVVIDDVFARKYFPNTDPVGKRIRSGDGKNSSTIVGVVGHVKQAKVDADDRQPLQPQLYLPFRQMTGGISEVDVVLRADGAVGKGAALFDSIRRVVQRQHSHNVIYRMQTMNGVIAASLAMRRFATILLSAFAVAALSLASIGLYGVISYLVGQRTHELGIRRALGAERRDVVGLILNHAMKMVLGGVVLGLLAAVGLTRLLSNLIYGVSTTDATTFIAVTSLLAAVALVSCFVPAWRATKVDPLSALSHE